MRGIPQKVLGIGQMVWCTEFGSGVEIGQMLVFLASGLGAVLDFSVGKAAMAAMGGLGRRRVWGH